uniref:VQ domain-containing protein n=1 Tax=Strongyloides venezuelensis TaxID=75913 RepID=A0A0K0FYH3_STRVS
MNRFQTAFIYPNGTLANNNYQSSYKVALLHVLKMKDDGKNSNISRLKESSSNGNTHSLKMPEYVEKFIAAGTNPGISNIMIDQSQSVAIDEFQRNSGEIDMLIGFLVMNGACIVFFLLFGLCVIFNCMRQKPKIFSQDKIYKKTLAKTVAKAPTNQKVTVLPKDAVVIDVQSKKFKDLVTKVMKTDEFEKMKNTNNNVKINIEEPSSIKRTNFLKKQLSLKDEDQSPGILNTISKNLKHSLKSTALITNNDKRVSISVESSENIALREKSNFQCQENIHFIDSTDTNNHIILTDQNPNSLVRQNIFGPLSFDDLYYT